MIIIKCGRMVSPKTIQKLILEILSGKKEDMIILEIAEKARIHRLTAAKYLAVLEVMGFVRHRTVGRAKLYSVGKRERSESKDIKEFLE